MMNEFSVVENRHHLLRCEVCDQRRGEQPVLPAEPAADSPTAKRPRLDPSEALPSACLGSAAHTLPLMPKGQAAEAGRTEYSASGDSGALDVAVDAGDWEEEEDAAWVCPRCNARIELDDQVPHR